MATEKEKEPLHDQLEKLAIKEHFHNYLEDLTEATEEVGEEFWKEYLKDLEYLKEELEEKGYTVEDESVEFDLSQNEHFPEEYDDLFDSMERFVEGVAPMLLGEPDLEKALCKTVNAYEGKKLVLSTLTVTGTENSLGLGGFQQEIDLEYTLTWEGEKPERKIIVDPKASPHTDDLTTFHALSRLDRDMKTITGERENLSYQALSRKLGSSLLDIYNIQLDATGFGVE